LPLNQQALAELYEPVDPTADTSLSRMFADLRGEGDTDPVLLALLDGLPCQSQ
jgi:hypothetical protein